MATRCVIEFTEAGTEVGSGFLVYQHWDGDPDTVENNVRGSLPLAWPLPRYEPDEFAAAFVAANKCGTGNIRLLRGTQDIPGDIERYYRVYMMDNNLVMSCFAHDGNVITHPMGPRRVVMRGAPCRCSACGQELTKIKP